MATVRLAAFGPQQQVAVVTSTNLLGVGPRQVVQLSGYSSSAKPVPQQSLWGLPGYDAELHNSNIQGLAFSFDGSALVAWTPDIVLAWTVNLDTGATARVPEDDFDVVTKELLGLVTSKKRVLAVQHDSSNLSYIVYTDDNDLRVAKITDKGTVHISLPTFYGLARAAVISQGQIIVRTFLDVRTCFLVEGDGVRQEWNILKTFQPKDQDGEATLAVLGDRLYFVNQDWISISYGLADCHNIGQASIQGDPTQMVHMRVLNSKLLVVSKAGLVEKWNAIGCKGAAIETRHLDLSRVLDNKDVQQHLKIIKEGEEAEKKRVEEKNHRMILERAKEDQLNMLYHNENADTRHRQFLLGVSAEAGAVSDWNSVEPYMFRSGPAVGPALSLGGGFLPSGTADNSAAAQERILQQLQEITKAVTDLQKQVADLRKA